MPSAVCDDGTYLNEACDLAESKTITNNGISHSDSIPSHPLGVKPLGNLYLFEGHNARRSIGTWDTLPDEMLTVILEHFDKSSLLRIGHTCKFFYAFCHSEELWKALFLQ